MNASGIDHINLVIPEDGVEKALKFYRDILGFETIKLEDFQRDKRTSFFFRIGKRSVINIRPKKDFIEPSGRNLDHFCIFIDEDIKDIRETLEENDIEILRHGEPFGAHGRGPAVYIRDPFGYKIELKTEK